MSEPGKFKAFLSYSGKDEAVVRRLHARLEAFAPPRALRAGGRARLGRFFRDQETSAALSDETRERLLPADWLIVCCSPDSVVSSRVDAVVDGFVNAHGFDRVLLVVLDGEPRDVVPPRLRARNPETADFRASVDGEDIGFLKLAASLLNVGLGELRDRVAAGERARLRNVSALAALLAPAPRPRPGSPSNSANAPRRWPARRSISGPAWWPRPTRFRVAATRRARRCGTC
jgi:TIR domain